jgi:hypothetical protein
MGWKSDWLYHLVFDEVEKLWNHAAKHSDGRFGPPPTAFVIREMLDGDWENGHCRGDARRRWLYQGGKPEPIVGDTNAGELRGMFFERGSVAFFIARNRKRVLFTYLLGPRYGMGKVLGVVGQGARAKLSPCSGCGWVS